jgi:hypothetical protein
MEQPPDENNSPNSSNNVEIETHIPPRKRSKVRFIDDPDSTKEISDNKENNEVNELKPKARMKPNFGKSSADLKPTELSPKIRRSQLKRSETLSQLVKHASSRNLRASWGEGSQPRQFQIVCAQSRRSLSEVEPKRTRANSNSQEVHFEHWVSPVLQTPNEPKDNAEAYNEQTPLQEDIERAIERQEANKGSFWERCILHLCH